MLYVKGTELNRGWDQDQAVKNPRTVCLEKIHFISDARFP